MKSHLEIDQRSMALAKAVVQKIEEQPDHAGIEQAKQLCKRWLSVGPSPAVSEWRQILDHSWLFIRGVLLDESEEGCRLRQSMPFCGILSPVERWDIYKRFNGHEKKSA